jgi:extracellular matrix regulatory protein B
MYIYLGGDKVIRSRELIAIFDMASDKSAMPTLVPSEDAADIEKIGTEPAKSLVVTESKSYYSPISSSTLKKRARTLGN